MNKINIEIGKKYNKWTIISQSTNKIKKNGQARMVLCICECGKEKIIEFSALTKNRTKGCSSCWKIGKTTWNKGKKLSEDTKEKMSISRRGKRVSIKSEFKKGMTPWNKGVKMPPMSEEWKKNISNGSKGEKNCKWIKDRTKLKDDSKERGGQLHKEWSITVKKRDLWKCKISNSECSGRLESHHILSWSDHPELRYDINNGITLCHFHHPRKREEEKRLSSYFKDLVSVSKV